MPEPAEQPEFCFSFDMQLPCMQLEAGAQLASHIVRTFYASSAPGAGRDHAMLTAQLGPVLDSQLAVPAQVVKRSAQAIAKIPKLATGFALDGAIPTIVVVHALTGDARVVGPLGFWESMGAPGAPLDTQRVRVLCINLLGSCYGSSGPCDADFPRLEHDTNHAALRVGKGAFQVPAQRMPATVTTFDQARSILLALDALGVGQVELLIGGSLGGMVALVMAALDPSRFRVVAPIAAADCASPWIQAWNHIGRAAIWADEVRGFELARQLGMLSYRAERGFELTQGTAKGQGLQPDQPFPIQTWLEYQGRKLAQRFDVEAYLCLLGAMDFHDLARIPDSAAALAKTHLVGISISSDQLFTPIQTLTFLQRVRDAGGSPVHEQIVSDFGHDAFLIEWTELTRVMKLALATTRKQFA